MLSTRVEDFRLEDWLPYWLSADELIAGLASLAVLVAFVAVWQALRGQSGAFERRFARIAAQRESLRQAALELAAVAPANDRGEVNERGRDTAQPAALAACAECAHAAGSGGDTVERGDGPLSVRAAVDAVRVRPRRLADASGPLLLPIPEQLRMLAALGAAVLGFYAPDIFLKNLIQKRSRQIELGLPDALDLLVICAEAGLSLDAALVRVSRELELTWPELSEEFGITAAELTYLPERKPRFRQSERAHPHGVDPRRREHAAADREIRYAAGPVAARAGRRIPRKPH